MFKKKDLAIAIALAMSVSQVGLGQTPEAGTESPAVEAPAAEAPAAEAAQLERLLESPQRLQLLSV